MGIRAKGRWYVFGSFEWLQQNFFPHLKRGTFFKLIKILKRLNLLIIEKLHPDKRDRTNYYSINLEGLEEFFSTVDSIKPDPEFAIETMENKKTHHVQSSSGRTMYRNNNMHNNNIHLSRSSEEENQATEAIKEEEQRDRENLEKQVKQKLDQEQEPPKEEQAKGTLLGLKGVINKLTRNIKVIPEQDFSVAAIAEPKKVEIKTTPKPVKKEQIIQSAGVDSQVSTKLEQMGIPLDQRLIEALKKYHLSQALSALNEIEKRSSSVGDKAAYLIKILPLQPVERLGMISPEIGPKMREDYGRIEEEMRSQEYKAAWAALKAKLPGRFNRG
ncbi:hypothetical protein Xen7305DRAFT_00008330 [Xenococcus sp. PCC 7305]|nr:hypothetical protein Xen7305DRAFT_00008330 [Xenococcus sp. PCC 7305]